MDTVSFNLPTATVQLLKNLAKSVKPADIYAIADKVFAKAGLVVAGRVVKTMLSGQRRKRRTGALAGSVTGGAVRVNGVPALRVGVFRGPAMKYAAIQERGTKGKDPNSPFPTIVPKKAKALAMPVNDALTPAGVSRYGSPRNYPHKLKFIPFRGAIAIGALYDLDDLERSRIKGLRDKKGRFKKGPYDFKNVLPLYILLRKMDISPGFFLRDGTLAELPYVAEQLVIALRKGLLNASTKPV